MTKTFKTNLIYFILISLFVGVRIMSALGLVFNSYVFNLIIQVFIMFLLPLFLYSMLFKMKPKQVFKEFRFKKISLKTIGISLGMGVLLYVIILGVSTFFSFILGWFGYNPSIGASGGEVVNYDLWYFLLQTLFVAILPGFCEEFAHRGLVLNGNRELGIRRAVVYSAILFGLMHLNIGQFFYATIAGGIMAITTIATGSIIPAILIHFTNNFISVFLSFASNKGWFSISNIFSGSGTGVLSGLLFTVILFGVVIVLMITAIRYLFKKNFSEKFLKERSHLAHKKLRALLLKEPFEECNPKKGLVSDELVQLDEGQGVVVRVVVPFENLGLNLEPTTKPSRTENAFFIGSVVLGGLVTMFTLIWGIIA